MSDKTPNGTAASLLAARIRRGEAYFGALDVLEVVEAAEAFVATTSVFRQPKDSRPEFEALCEALVRAGRV